MTLDELQTYVWRTMEAKGFHDGRRGDGRDDTLVRLMLVVTEVAEAAQVVKRHGLTGGEVTSADTVRRDFAAEVADVAIRLLDIAGCVGFSLQAAVLDKMGVNEKRPFKYGTPDEGRAA